LAGVGGLEAELMRASGGAYGAAAAQLPKTASLEAQLMMKDLISGAGEADKSFSDQILSVLQSLPGARQGFTQQATSDRLAQQKFKLDQLEEERDWYLKQAALASAMGDDKRAEAYLKLAQQREDRYAKASRGMDVDGNPKPGFHLNKNGDIVPDAGKGSTSSTTPGTPAWRAAQVKAVGKAQNAIENDVEAYMEASPTVPPGRQTQLHNQLRKDLWEKYSYLATTPTAKRALRKAIALAVRRYKAKPKTGGAIPGAPLPAPEK
jgi:hypothetical protein